MNGYKRTLREHTYNHRIRQLLNHINIYIEKTVMSNSNASNIIIA